MSFTITNGSLEMIVNKPGVVKNKLNKSTTAIKKNGVYEIEIRSEIGLFKGNKLI